MAEYERTIGVVVGGYGLDTSKSGGTAWCFGAPPTGTTIYDWRQTMTTPPDTVGIDVNPTTGAFAASSFSFELALTDEVAETLLYQQRRADFVMGLDRSATANAVTVLDADGAAVTTLSNTVIYVGDEALLLGTYDTDVLGGGYLVTRGYYSTNAQPHAAGDFAYLDPHFIRFRDLRLVLYDNDNETESVVWRGFVDDLETNEEGTALEITGVELYGVLQAANVNRTARNLEQFIPINKTPDGISSKFPVGFSDSFNLPGTLGGGSSIFKSGEADPDVAIQLSAEMFVYALYDVSAPSFSEGVFPASFGVTQLPDEEETFDSIYELFVVDYGIDAGLINSDGTATAAMTTDGVSATRELEYPFHPLAIALGFLLSTVSSTASQADYDVYSGNWSLQVNSDDIDITTFEALIAKYPTYRIERMILGWDGEPVNVWETIRDYCLRPFGFFFGTDVEGRIVAAEYVTQVGIGDFYNSTDLTVVPNTLRYQASKQDGVDEVIGIIGQTPWDDGYTLTISGPRLANKNSVRNRVFAERRVSEYIIPFGQVDTIRESSPRAYALLESRAVSGAFAVPRVIIRTIDPDIDGLNYALGQFVNISNLDVEAAWLVNKEGDRITLDGTANLSATGIIVGREYEVATSTYTLTLLLQGNATEQLVRWRAPAALVGSSSTTTSIVVSQNAFHSNANDTSFFTVGDEVYVYESTGEYADGSPAVVQSVTATSIDVLPALGSAPAAGQIVRLADYGAYSNSDVIDGAGDNVYFYISTDGVDLDGTDDPHRYG